MTPAASAKPSGLSRSGQTQRIGHQDIAFFTLFVALGVFQIISYQRRESVASNSSVYITAAHNLLQTGRYEFNYRPETLFPPGFPMILAGVSLMTGHEGYGLFVRLMPVFSTLGLMVWYFVLKRYSGATIAGGACLLVATTAPLFALVTQDVGSDPVFFLVSGLALWCCVVLDQKDVAGPARFLLFAGASVLTVAATLIRSAGIVLSASMVFWIVAEIWGRGPRTRLARQAAVGGAVAGFCAFATWTVWSKRAEQLDYPGEHMESYASAFAVKDPHRPELGKASPGDFVLRAASNVPVQAAYVTRLLLQNGRVAALWNSPFIVIPLALLLFGSVSYVHSSQAALLGGYFMAYFGLYILWPFDEGARFILPVAPLAFVLLWRGLVVIGKFIEGCLNVALALVSISSAALAAASAAVPQSRGLQARMSLVFWPCLAVLTAILALLAYRTGVVRAGTILKSTRSQILAALGGIVALLCVVGVAQQISLARTNMASDASKFRHYPSMDCASWLRTAGDGVVMAGQDVILHRLTGRRVVAFPISSDARLIADVVRASHVRFLVVNDPVDYEYFFPIEMDRYDAVARAYPAMFEMVHRGPGYRVFEIREGR